MQEKDTTPSQQDPHVVVKKTQYILKRKQNEPWMGIYGLMKACALSTGGGIILGAILGSMKGNFRTRGAMQLGTYAFTSSLVYLGMQQKNFD